MPSLQQATLAKVAHPTVSLAQSITHLCVHPVKLDIILQYLELAAQSAQLPQQTPIAVKIVEPVLSLHQAQILFALTVFQAMSFKVDSVFNAQEHAVFAVSIKTHSLTISPLAQLAISVTSLTNTVLLAKPAKKDVEPASIQLFAYPASLDLL